MNCESASVDRLESFVIRSFGRRRPGGVGVGGGGGGSGASSELVALGVILRYAEPS